MGKHLLRSFAVGDPERFAQLLGRLNDPVEAVAILTDIPDGLECDVLARLTPEAARRLLGQLSDEILIVWLNTCTAEAGRRLLARISRDRAEQLIAGIRDRSIRRRLRRLVDYPPGSIGELVQFGVMAVKATDQASGIVMAMQHHGGASDAPVVIVRDDGNVAGVLDLAMLLKNRNERALATDFLIPVEPAIATASLLALRNRIEWGHLTSLPVVTHEGQLIGYVSRSRMEEAMGSGSQDNILVESAVELSRRFLDFMVYTLVWIFDRNSRQ